MFARLLRRSSFALILLLSINALGAATPATVPVETRQQREARMAWWKEARFGLFIHWGLYAIPAGEWEKKEAKHPFLGTEWIMCYSKIPVATYRELASKFNPTKFNAADWVRMAKNAGMKYIVLTAKHHDGFALFDSDASDFNVVDATPFKRDIVREIAEACRKKGIKLGLYYSQAQDWSHPGGAVSSFMKPWDPAQAGSFDEYAERIAVPQVKEILSKYGPVSILWWDTPQDMTPGIAARFQEALSLQPGILQNNRLINSNPGDFREMEGKVPVSDVPATPWEACVMMNGSWGYSRVHHEWLSARTLIRQLIQAASLGGNYLLNIGPDAEGAFPPEAIDRLERIGAWMKTNGAAIYGSSGFPMKKLWQQGRITQKPGLLYAAVFLWPGDGRLTIPVNATPRKVSLLSRPGEALAFTAGEKGILVEVPRNMPDPDATVLMIEIEGKATEVATLPALDSDGTFDLLAAYATISGTSGAKPTLAVGKREGTAPPLTGDPAEGFKLGGFATPDEKAVWHIRILKPGKYNVVAYPGLHKNMPNDLNLEVRAAGQTLQKPIPLTGDSQMFKPLDLGPILFDTPGEYQVELSIDLKSAKSTGCNLWRIQLQPLSSSR